MSKYREWKAAALAAKVHENATQQKELRELIRKRFARIAGHPLPEGLMLKRRPDGSHVLLPEPYEGRYINPVGFR